MSSRLRMSEASVLAPPSRSTQRKAGFGVIRQVISRVHGGDFDAQPAALVVAALRQRHTLLVLVHVHYESRIFQCASCVPVFRIQVIISSLPTYGHSNTYFCCIRLKDMLSNAPLSTSEHSQCRSSTLAGPGRPSVLLRMIPLALYGLPCQKT